MTRSTEWYKGGVYQAFGLILLHFFMNVRIALMGMNEIGIETSEFYEEGAGADMTTCQCLLSNDLRWKQAGLVSM
jgi:hypothetical protein